ncbi:hypothetical protein ACFPM0_28550 [Pseudonocardia sulfidoxydans]|uniref:hypothetical protein n=1 Tax=Pseudonocardia sulfidoxydans TaxID=54011 RepID=UPI0036130AA2
MACTPPRSPASSKIAPKSDNAAASISGRPKSCHPRRAWSSAAASRSARPRRWAAIVTANGCVPLHSIRAMARSRRSRAGR